MKPRTLLILAVLVAGLGAFVWFGRELPSTEDLEARAKRVVLIEPDEVSALQIERAGRTLRLVREVGESDPAEGSPGEWRLITPVDARADGPLVDGLVSRLVGLEKERTLEDVERAAVGLETPRALVRLSTASGETVLEIGAEVPASDTMTLAIEGEAPVFVVPSLVWSDLAKEAGEWRDKNLFTGQRSDIERISLENAGERVVLARRGDDFWVESPIGDRADQTLVNGLISTITSLRAERFVDEGEADRAARGLDPAEVVIEVTLGGRETPMRLELGHAETGPSGGAEAGAAAEGLTPPESSPTPPAFLLVDGELVTSTAALGEHGRRPASAWRSSDLVSGEVYELARLEVEDAQASTIMERVDGGWRRDGESIDFGAATDLLYEISGGSAARVVDAGSLGDLGAAELTFRLVADGEEGSPPAAPEVLELFAPIGEETPARVSDRDVVLMLSAETVASLREKLATLRAAPVEPDEIPAPLSPGGDQPPATEDPGGA